MHIACDNVVSLTESDKVVDKNFNTHFYCVIYIYFIIRTFKNVLMNTVQYLNNIGRNSRYVLEVIYNRFFFIHNYYSYSKCSEEGKKLRKHGIAVEEYFTISQALT